MWRSVRYLVFALCLGALLAALLLSLAGAPAGVARAVERRLRFGDLHLTFDKLKLGVFEGVIATRVQGRRPGALGTPLVQAEKIVLRLRPLAWLRGSSGISGALVKNGVIALDPDGAAAERGLALRDVFADLAWDERAARVEVRDLSARLPGVRLAGRGVLSLATPATAERRPPAPAAETPTLPWSAVAARWIEAAAITNDGADLKVDVTFALDPTALDTAQVQVRIDGRQTRARRARLESWSLRLSTRGRSGAGQLDIGRAEIAGIPVAAASGRFQFTPRGLTIERLAAEVGSEAWRGPCALTGAYTWAERRFAGHAESACDPRLLLPLLQGWELAAAEVLENFRFEAQPPVGKADVAVRAGPGGGGVVVAVSGQAQGDTCVYRGVTNLLMRMGFAVAFSETNEVLVLDPLLVVREEGTVQGQARLDFAAKTLRLAGQSTADPRAVARMADPAVERIVAPFRFAGPARVAARGLLDYGRFERSDLDVDVDIQRLGWLFLLADRAVCNVRLLDGTAFVNDVQVDLFRGRLEGSGQIFPAADGTPLAALSATVRDVDVRLLARALAGQTADQQHGALSGTLALEGALDDPGGRRWTGRGALNIANGQLFQIPIFGGFTEFMSRIVPGLSLLVSQTDAKATFEVRNGQIQSDDIIIQGDVIAVTAKGRYTFGGELDFAVQVKLLKQHTLVGSLVQFALSPVSKALEFRLTGSPANPRWRPAYLPKEMFLIFK